MSVIDGFSVYPSLSSLFLLKNYVNRENMLMHILVHSCSCHRRRGCHQSKVLVSQVYHTVLCICWLNNTQDIIQLERNKHSLAPVSKL